MPMQVPPFSTALTAYSTCEGVRGCGPVELVDRSHLEVATVGGEDGILKIIACANGGLGERYPSASGSAAKEQLRRF